jgi:hypothetical protein
VCVQPLVSHVAREQQDLTGDKTDEGDCGLVSRRALQAGPGGLNWRALGRLGWRALGGQAVGA